MTKHTIYMNSHVKTNKQKNITYAIARGKTMYMVHPVRPLT